MFCGARICRVQSGWVFVVKTRWLTIRQLADFHPIWPCSTRESTSPRHVPEGIFENVTCRGYLPPKTSQLKGRYLTQTNLQPKGRIAKRLFTPHCSPLQGPCSFWGRITLFALSPNKLSKAKGIFHWDVGNSHCACAAADFRISNFFTARWYA